MNAFYYCSDARAHTKVVFIKTSYEQINLVAKCDYLFFCDKQR